MKRSKYKLVFIIIYLINCHFSPLVLSAQINEFSHESLAPVTSFETFVTKGQTNFHIPSLWGKMLNWLPGGVVLSVSISMMFSPKIALAQMKEQDMMLKYLEASALPKKFNESYKRDTAALKDRQNARLPEFRLGIKGGVYLAPYLGQEGENERESFGGTSSASLLFPASGTFLETSFDLTYNKGSVLKFGLYQNILRDSPFIGINAVTFEYERSLTERQKTQIYNSIEIISGLSEVRLAFWQYQSYTDILDELKKVSGEIDKILSFEKGKINIGEGTESELMRVKLKKIEIERFILQMEGQRSQILKWLSVKTGINLKINDIENLDLPTIIPYDLSGIQWLKWVDSRLDPSSRLRKLLVKQQADIQEYTKNISASALSVGAGVEKIFNPASGQISGSDFVGISLSFSPSVRSVMKQTQEKEKQVRELDALETYRNIKADVERLIEIRKNTIARLKKINEAFDLLEKRTEILWYRYTKSVGSDSRAKEPIEIWFEYLNLKKEITDLHFQLHSEEVELDKMTGYLLEKFPALKPHAQSVSA